MSKQRDLHISSLVIGRKGTGKSTYLAQLALSYPSKVLILDVNGSPAYNQFRPITIDQVKKFREGKVKLMGTPTKETLLIIAENFRNGLVIFEDCTKYIPPYPQPEIKAFLVDHRMLGCDLVFTFHSVKMVPPFFWQMVTYAVLMKTQEEVESSRNKSMIPNYAEFVKAFKRVNTHKSNYYNETIETFV